MSASNARTGRSRLAAVVGEPERGGAGSPEEIARRLGPDWTQDRVLAALAELF